MADARKLQVSIADLEPVKAALSAAASFALVWTSLPQELRAAISEIDRPVAGHATHLADMIARLGIKP